MRKELEQKLARRWPDWFGLAGNPRLSPMARGFEHGDGWYNILWRLCADLGPLVAELEKETGGRFEVLQVKQKFGTVVGQFARSDASSMWLLARAKGATAGSFRVGDYSGVERLRSTLRRYTGAICRRNLQSRTHPRTGLRDFVAELWPSPGRVPKLPGNFWMPRDVGEAREGTHAACGIPVDIPSHQQSFRRQIC
jgi:hypothetical protein